MDTEAIEKQIIADAIRYAAIGSTAAARVVQCQDRPERTHATRRP